MALDKKKGGHDFIFYFYSLAIFYPDKIMINEEMKHK